jgi:hypothetical protein
MHPRSPVSDPKSGRRIAKRIAKRIATRVVARASAVVALAACTSLTSTNPAPNRYGSVSVIGKNAANSRASAKATAIFFEAYTAAVPSSVLQQTDQCVYSTVDTATTVTKGVKQAGTSVSLGVAGSSVSMPYDAGLFRYATPDASPFSYGRGDVVQATIPGDPAVYPAASISVKLAEPLVPGTITVPTGTTPMVFTWNTPETSDTTSAIILSLRYANPATSSYGNEQIYCALKDDGVHQLPTTALQAFLASPNDKRSLVMTRWRTRELSVDSRTILHIASSVDTTLKFTP